MILVDSSIWIDHLRKSDRAFSNLLNQDLVLVHPFIIGELAMGGIGNRQDFLSFIQEFPQALVAHDDEVLAFVTRHKLFGTGIGYIDAHLLASTQLTPGAAIWTRDRGLNEIATKLLLGISQ